MKCRPTQRVLLDCPCPGCLLGLCDLPGHHVPGISCSAVGFCSPTTCQWLFTHLVKPQPSAGRPWECLCPLVRDRGVKSGPGQTHPLLGRLRGLNSAVTASRPTAFLSTTKAQPQLDATTVAWSPTLPSERRHSWIVEASGSLRAACFVRIPGTPGIRLVCWVLHQLLKTEQPLGSGGLCLPGSQGRRLRSHHQLREAVPAFLERRAGLITSCAF